MSKVDKHPAGEDLSRRSVLTSGAATVGGGVALAALHSDGAGAQDIQLQRGYLIANIMVTDPDRYEQYRARVPQVVAQYGGRYLVRAGALHALEGDFGFNRVAIIEFPSLDAARRFYNSPEYAPLLKLRMETARSEVALLEGVPPA